MKYFTTIVDRDNQEKIFVVEAKSEEDAEKQFMKIAEGNYLTKRVL